MLTDEIRLAYGSPLEEAVFVTLPYQEGEGFVDTLSRGIDAVDERRGTPIQVDIDLVTVTVDGVKLEGDLRDAQAIPPGAWVSVSTLPRVELIAGLIFSALGLGVTPAFIYYGVYAISYAIVIGALTGLNYALGELLRDDLDSAEPGSRARTLSGSRNRVEPYAPIPRVYGTWRYAPPMAARPHTEIAGGSQYLRQAFLWGFGELDVSDVRIGNTAIASFDDVTHTVETIAASPQALTNYREDVSEQSVGVTIESDWLNADNSVIRTTAANTTEFVVDVLFPAGLFAIDPYKGATRNAGTRLSVSYRATGSGDPWSAFTGSVRTFNERKKDAFFATFRKTGLASGTYDVRVLRTDDATTDQANRLPSSHGGTGTDVASRADDIQWLALKSYQDSVPVKETGTVVSSMRIKATDQLNGPVETLSGLVTSKLRTVSSGVYQSTTTATSNPAWVALDILVGSANAKPRAVADIDLTAFESFASFCTTEGFEFHHIFDYTSENVYDAAQQAARAVRGTLTLRGDKISVIWDTTR